MSPAGWPRLILALYGLLALGYSLLMPMWEAPDESAHYLVVYYHARHGRPPTFEETYEAIQPPLYYWLASGVVRLLDQVNPDLSALYRPPLSPVAAPTRYDWQAENYRFLWTPHLLRWLNILIGGGALLFIYHAARRLVRLWPAAPAGAQTTVPVATLALAGLSPQFLHNSAAVSNDPLANLGGGFLFWCLSLVCAGPPPRWPMVGVTAAALALPFLVKLNLLPLSLALLAAIAWQTWPASSARRWRPLSLGLVGGGALVVGLLALAPTTAGLLARTVWWRLVYVRPDFPTRWPAWRILAFYVASYWGQVAWEEVRLPGAALAALSAAAALGALASLRLLLAGTPARRFVAAVLLASAAGLLALLLLARFSAWWRLPWAAHASAVALLLLGGWWLRRHDPAGRIVIHRPSWALVWLAAGLALAVVFKNFLTTPQYQGRFFFPALGPISLLLAAGWYALAPARTAARLPQLLLAVMLGLSLLLWVTRVIPIYYQPFLD